VLALVSAGYSLEIFSGSARLTAAAAASGLRTLPPVDVANGWDPPLPRGAARLRVLVDKAYRTICETLIIPRGDALVLISRGHAWVLICRGNTFAAHLMYISRGHASVLMCQGNTLLHI